MKIRKQLKRILALFLIVIMASTSTSLESFAAETASGATNPSQKGDAGVTNYDPNITAFMKPAWLVYIQTVGRTEVPAGSKLTEVKNSAIEAMLYNYPQEYVTGDNSFYTDRCAVIIDKGSANYSGNVNVYKPDGSLSGAINHVYHVSGSAPSGMSMTIVSDDILPSDAYIEKFRKGQMTMSDYNAALSSIGRNGMSVDTAIKNFVNHFADIGSLSDKIIKTTEETQQAYPDYFDTIRNTQMLNLLGTINAMCGNSYNAVIENYLVSQNKNGSDEFYIPVIIAGFVANNEGQPPAFYSLPTYYHKTYGADTTALFNIPRDTAEEFGDYSSSYEYKVHDYYEEHMGGIKPGSKFFMYRVGSWWNYTYGSTSMTGMKGQAYTCMPTDPEDMMRGNLGYTYFTFGGEGEVIEDGGTLGQFNITASSEQKNVTAPNTSVAALINVDLNCTTQQRQSIRDTFDNEKKEGYDTADIIIDYSYASVAGNGSSSPLIDTVFTSGATLSGGNRVTLSNMTYDKLKPYIEGSKLIQVADSGILISGATTNKYLASVTIKFPDKSYKMLAKGKKIESDTQGSDTVMWGLNDVTGMDERVHYYSSIGKDGIQDNYVEIKHNTPGHEEYEAMAGIPTTEDLYVGFGITEFMVNMDAEKAESPASTRYYTYEYTAANCYGHDEPCVYSCPGNHKGGSGGCGALICTNTDPRHTHGGSCYCGSGHYTKNDFNCSDDGKWEWEWVCNCSDSFLAGDSGTASYGPGYTQCIGVDGSDDGTGGTTYGCQHTEHLNTTHCGVTFTGVVEQPIDSFYYLDITDLNLWRVSSLKADLNQKLFSKSDLEWDPGTGYFTYYNQEGYKNGNGRLVFKTSTNDTAGGSTNNSTVYGDSKSTCPNPDGGVISWEEATAAAATWMNETLSGSTVTAMVVSDYASLATTIGYNNVSYHSYLSDTVPIISGGFSALAYTETHSASLTTVRGNTITFSNKPKIQDLWQNNTYSAAKWSDKDITRSGYNGQYNSPGTKWNNGNTKTAVCPLITVMTAWQPRATRAIHPNSKNLRAPTLTDDGFSNLTTTKTGLDINDVMSTEERTWPQSSEPRVSNGTWDTGHCYIKAERVVKEGNPGGVDYSYLEQYNEVGYTAGKTEVNDIVVHNPVSTQNAYILCNDSKYDLRSDASLAAGGDPTSDLDFCPGNASCSNQVLTCGVTIPILHTDACYATVNTNTVHSGLKTVHTHTTECTHVHTSDCYDR